MHQIQINLDSPNNRKTKLTRNTNLKNNYQNTSQQLQKFY